MRLPRAQGLVAASFAALGCLAPSSQAQEVPRDCFRDAAQRYSVDARLLRAIAKVESSFNPAAVHVNRDGTRDVGLMQINSSHFGELRGFGIDEATLLSQPCTNVAVGAWVLAGFIRRHGLTWRAVGSYNAGDHPSKESARLAYAVAVSRALKLDRAQGPESTKASPAAVRLAVRRMQVVE